MKMPAPPPDNAQLFNKLAEHGERFIAVITSTSSGVAEQQYLPWDKLRYKTPPDGLSHEEWWYGVRLARRGMQRVLPFRDKESANFTYAIPDEVLRGLDEITRRASGEIAISEEVTNRATRDRYIVNSLIEEAITSSQLEGASTSRSVAKEMIRSGREPRDNSERMIHNNYLAMRRLSELRNEQLTSELVCDLHRIVTEGTLEDPSSGGRVQANPDPADRVVVFGDYDQVIHRPPPVEELPERLELLCQFANGEDQTVWIPPFLRALVIHFMIGYDHYFEDGNGRLARILFYWSMLNQGYWLTEFLTISSILKRAPAQYARSFVLTEQDEGDVTHFFIYHLKVVRRAIDELHRYLTRKVEELRETRVLLATMPGEFNHRQLALLEAALKTQDQTYTVQSHLASHNVSPETARQDLLDLERRGLLQSARIRRRYVWRAVPNLSTRIRDGRGNAANQASGGRRLARVAGPSSSAGAR